LNKAEGVLKMRLRRIGLNAMSCILEKKDIDELGYNPNAVLNGKVSDEVMKIANFVVNLLGDNLVPIPLPSGLPMDVKTIIGKNDIDFEVSIPCIPFEIFNFEDDFDIEFEISDYAEYFNDINNAINSLEDEENEEWYDECSDNENEKEQDDETSVENVLLFKFKTLKAAMDYAKMSKNIKEKPKSSLYKLDGYWLVCNFGNINEKILKAYAYIFMESNGDASKNRSKVAYIKEHGEIIIEQNALDKLASI
jgi:hypothetical protein